MTRATPAFSKRPERRRWLGAFVSLGVVGGLAFAPTVAAGSDVSITDFAFTPDKLTVSQSSSVAWSNNGAFSHSVTSDGTLAFWPSHDIGPSDAAFLKTFKAAGTFPYHCRFHGSMLGKIKVPLLVDHAGVDFTINAMMGTSDWPAASPFRNVIQVRPAGSSTWMTISQSRSGQATFHATQGAGEYSFRSAVRRATSGAMSLWSRVVKVVIG